MIFIIINKSILKLFFFLFAAEASGLDDCDKSTFKKELISIWWLLQLCLTLSLLMGCSPPGLSVHGIFQARILESGRGQHNIVNQLSILQLKKKNKKKKDHWSGLPCPPPGDLPPTGTKLASPVSCFSFRHLGSPLSSAHISSSVGPRTLSFRTVWPQAWQQAGLLHKRSPSVEVAPTALSISGLLNSASGESDRGRAVLGWRTQALEPLGP